LQYLNMANGSRNNHLSLLSRPITILSGLPWLEVGEKAWQITRNAVPPMCDGTPFPLTLDAVVAIAQVLRNYARWRGLLGLSRLPRQASTLELALTAGGASKSDLTGTSSLTLRRAFFPFSHHSASVIPHGLNNSKHFDGAQSLCYNGFVCSSNATRRAQQ
jgi:hypothetical protein